MIITITNPRNNLSLNFLGSEEYRKKHGVKTLKEKADIAITARDYELYARGLSGVFSLPTSQSYFVTGYAQDGSDFQYNTYENRIITFEFVQHYGFTLTQQSQVFNQLDHLLDIRILTAAGAYHIRGHLNGTTEAGLVELTCPYPYFTTEEKIIHHDILWLVAKKRMMLPLRLPNMLFGETSQKGMLTLNALFPTEFKMILTGTFADIRIRGLNAGTVLWYQGSVEETMVVDTLEQKVIVDGNDVTDVVQGVFPMLLEGENTFHFVIPEGQQKDNIRVNVEYQEIAGNIE